MQQLKQIHLLLVPHTAELQNPQMWFLERNFSVLPRPCICIIVIIFSVSQEEKCSTTLHTRDRALRQRYINTFFKKAFSDQKYSTINFFLAQISS